VLYYVIIKRSLTVPNAVTIKQLLESGAHFGHQTSSWHPRMKSYIFTRRNGIHIIDLEQTIVMLDKACQFVRQLIADGNTILLSAPKNRLNKP